MSQPYGIDVLAFGPHPDDVELFCGGVLLSLADQGHSTGIVDLTRGELSSRGSVAERQAEAAAAARVLGVRFRDNLGLPDGFVCPWSGYEAPERQGRDGHLGKVVAAIRRHRPEVVLVPWLEERHPDHVATGELLTKAVFYAGLHKLETDPPLPPCTPRQLLYYQMRYRMAPSFVVDTSAVWERKVQAIACHGSQVGPRPGAPPTLVGSPLALEAIEARDRYHGSMIGVRFGEPLKSPGMLSVVDPLAFLRHNQRGPAHAFEAVS